MAFPSPSCPLADAMRRISRLAPGLLALALTCAPLGALADGDAPDSRRVLLRAAGPPPASRDTTWADIEELLVRGPDLASSVADGETLPDARPEAVLEQVGAMSCGTPLARAAERAVARVTGERLGRVGVLLAPPRLAAEQSLLVPGEPLIVRWDASVSSRHALLGRDGDGDRIPDAAQATADDARALLRRLADITGWDRRVEGGVIEIRLAATAFAEGAALPGPPPVVVLSREARGTDRLAALAHQLAHVVVRSLATDVPDTFEESVATWLGEAAFAQVAGLAVDASRLLPTRHPSRSILSPGIGAARGDASFLRFVTDVLAVPPTWVPDALAVLPRHLEEVRRAGRLAPVEAPLAAVAEAMDEALSRQGFSLAEAVAEYQVWALERDLLAGEPEISVDQEIDRLPDEMRFETSDLPAFGQVRLGLAAPESGGLQVAFEPGDVVRGVVVAAFADSSLRRFPLTGEGATVTLPSSSLRRAVVLVQSPGIPRRWSRWQVPATANPARLVASVDASWPFVLSAIDAEAAPGQITLSWDTSSEQDVTGWIVERAVRPAGPWAPMSAIPLPASSWPDAAASYSFVDMTPRPSQRYHYRVRALTLSGMSEMSPATSIRTLPRAR